MSDNKKAYFNPELVGQTYYITLEESGRNARFTQMAESIGLQAERVEGVHAAKLDDDARNDILARMKNKVIIGSKLEDTLEENCVPLRPDRLDKTLQQTAFSKYGCAASHMKTMEKALDSIKPGDEEKWIVILEDDAVLPKDSAEINRVLAEAPHDAGAMMLGVMHPRGAAPLETDNPNIMQPTKGNATVAIAYRPEMLRAMLEVYKANMEMGRKDGGISPIDNINAVIHQYIAFGDDNYLNRPEYKKLVGIFSDATADFKQYKFYAANPSLVQPLDEKSQVSGNHNASLVRADPLHVCDSGIAGEIQEKVNDILSAGLAQMQGGVVGDRNYARARGEMKDTIGKMVYTGELSPEVALQQLSGIEARVTEAAQGQTLPRRGVG